MPTTACARSIRAPSTSPPARPTAVFAVGSLDATVAGGSDDGDADPTPPATDTIASTDDATPTSSIPGFLVLAVFGAAFVGSLRLATVRARR